MFDISLSYPFVLGLVAAFNPCGFVMLPNYLSYFLGTDVTQDEAASPVRDLLRAMAIGLTMALGFVVVFGLVGVLTSTLVSTGDIYSKVPYVTLGLGVLLIPLGIAMLLGYEPKLATPRLNKGGGDRTVSSVFLFGVSYATISLSCTAPLFLAAVIESFTEDGIVDGSAACIAYAAGMAAVVTFLTMSVALARTSIVTRMRSFLPYINRVSGGLLIGGGLYLIAYGWYEIRIVLRGESVEANPIQQRFEDFQNHMLNWVDDVGGVTVGAALGVLIAVMLIAALRRSLPQRDWRLLAGGAVVAYLLIEFGFFGGDLFVLGTYHVLLGLPERVGHWFSDPLRWGAVLEVLLVVGLVAFAGAGLKRRRDDAKARVDDPVETTAP